MSEPIFTQIAELDPSGGSAISPPNPAIPVTESEDAHVMDSWEHLRRTFTGRLAQNILRAQAATRRLRTAIR